MILRLPCLSLSLYAMSHLPSLPKMNFQPHESFADNVLICWSADSFVRDTMKGCGERYRELKERNADCMHEPRAPDPHWRRRILRLSRGAWRWLFWLNFMVVGLGK